MPRLTAWIAATILALPALASAQQNTPFDRGLPGVQRPRTTPKVQLTVESTPSAAPGESATIEIGFRLPDETYIDRNNVRAELIQPPNWTLDKPQLPPGKTKTVAGATFELLTQNFIAAFPIRIPPDSSPAQVPVTLNVHYIACTGNLCIPAHQEINTTLAVTEPPPAAANNAQLVSPNKGFSARLADKLAASLESGNFLVFLPLAFLGGMLLALTPCVLPMVPIVVQIIVGGKETTTTRRIASVLFYTLGLSLVYATLGLSAAWFGGLVGAVLQNTWVLSALAALFVVLAMSMFGAYDLEMPASWRDKLQVKGKGDFLTAFLMGLVSGVIASPCIGPVISGVLGWIASTRNAPLGFSVLFTMGWGLGTPFILAAIAGGTLLKPGPWMEKVKKFLGLLLLAGSAYFANLAFKDGPGYWLLAAFCLVVALIGLAAYATAPKNTMRRMRIAGVWQTGAAGALLALVCGLFLAQPAYPTDNDGNTDAPKNKIEWVVDDLDAALERAKAQGKPALIYFTADWCIPCKEYKATTFTNPDVLKDFQRFVAIKADITKVTDPRIKKLTRRFKIFGPPVFIFITSSGEILQAREQRVEGFIGPQDFLQRLRQIG